MISLDDLRRAGLGHKTLREHGAVCPPGFKVVLDAQGDEVCVPDPNAPPPTPPIYVVEQPSTMVFPGFSHRHGGGSHHRHPRRAGTAGLGASASEIATFQELARQTRSFAARGDFANAATFFAQTENQFRAIGSPAAYQDDLDYARASVYGDGSEQVRQQQTQRAQAAENAQPSSISFLDDPLAALYFRGLDPVRFGSQGLVNTEQAAAEMRETGIPPLVQAGAPQSGRDATTKPPVSLPENGGRIALGAALGAGVGLGAGLLMNGRAGAPTVTSTLAGAAVGGLLGWIGGRS